ncbi:MAG: ammonia channel protein, partial [Methylophilaceae bacterium]
MKKLLAILALMSALSMSGLGLVSAAHADEVKTDAVATVVADAAVAPDAAAPAAETAAPAEAAKAPTPEKGDIAWMIVATILVTLMVIPGLGLFYGGLVRSKNMLSVLMQTFVVFSL